MSLFKRNCALKSYKWGEVFLWGSKFATLQRCTLSRARALKGQAAVSCFEGWAFLSSICDWQVFLRAAGERCWGDGKGPGGEGEGWGDSAPEARFAHRIRPPSAWEFIPSHMRWYALVVCSRAKARWRFRACCLCCSVAQSSLLPPPPSPGS